MVFNSPCRYSDPVRVGRHRQEGLSSPKPSRPLWGSPTLLFSRYWSSCPGGISTQDSGREAYHWPPTIFEVRNKWSYTSSPHIRLRSMNRQIHFFLFFLLYFVTLKIISKTIFFLFCVLSFLLSLLFPSFLSIPAFYSFLSFIYFITSFPLPFWST